MTCSLTPASPASPPSGPASGSIPSPSDGDDAAQPGSRPSPLEPFRDPATIAAICEEYRAAATIDAAHDEEDRPRRPITCPVLVLWSATGATAAWYDPLSIWRDWADDVSGAPLDCGHFLPEEAPDDTTRHLTDFLRRW